MDIQYLRKQARKYIENGILSDQDALYLSRTLSLEFEDSTTLASLIETLEVSNYGSNRQEVNSDIICNFIQ